MQRIAAPMIGGMLTTTVLTLLVLPAIYSLVVEYLQKFEAKGLFGLFELRNNRSA